MKLPAGVIDRALCTYSHIAPCGRGAYPLVRALLRWRDPLQNKSEFRTPSGNLLQLDLSTYPDCCMAFDLYELDTARLIRRLLKPGDHFVDGGANLGYFTLMAARMVGPTGRVDAFEPQPENRQRLLNHLQRNSFEKQVRVHAAALTDKPGEIVIHMFEGEQNNHGCASIFTGDTPPSSSTKTPAVRMDEVLKGTAPKLIKLDIEGAEPLAIAGMENLLETGNPPALICEFNPPQARAAGFAPEEFITRALKIQPRYQVFYIGSRLSPLSPDSATFASLNQCNLLLKT